MPEMLVSMTRLLLRYLTLIAERGQRMRQAAAARGSGRLPRRAMLGRAGGALGVLFVSSYERAEAVHWAMLSRGFTGRERLLSPPAPRWGTIWLPAAAAAAAGVIRYV